MDGEKMPAIGIPRAMLYYRYGALWEHFFQSLGLSTVLSPPGSRGILEAGTRLAPDESCLSLKMFMGHVDALVGRCERIFIPRYSNYGYTEFFCTRYEGIYDQARNIFRSSGQRFITCNIDVQNGSPEAKAFEKLGVELGFSPRQSRHAWHEAARALEQQQKTAEHIQKELTGKPGMKVLVAGHSYVLSDPYLGRPILDYLDLPARFPCAQMRWNRKQPGRPAPGSPPPAGGSPARKLSGACCCGRTGWTASSWSARFPAARIP